ncbi:MAG TPA: hypothetical protein QF611_00445 [Pseudomonadales bacterium]|nr:hypothetical protein [Pseudomonadales bacterium]
MSETVGEGAVLQKVEELLTEAWLSHLTTEQLLVLVASEAKKNWTSRQENNNADWVIAIDRGQYKDRRRQHQYP